MDTLWRERPGIPARRACGEHWASSQGSVPMTRNVAMTGNATEPYTFCVPASRQGLELEVSSGQEQQPHGPPAAGT